jgi:Family of unknown function (DUF6262)
VKRADNTRHLLLASAARHDTAVQRSRGAIKELERVGTPITFTTIARAARVSRGWLYNQPELRDAIIQLRRHAETTTRSTTPSTQRASTESLRQRHDSARDEITRLRVDNARLREQLARSLGEQRSLR